MNVALVTATGEDRGFVKADADLIRRMGHAVRLVGAGRITDAARIPLAVRRASRIVVWSVGEHTFAAVAAARLTGARSLVILGGGSEYTSDRALRYGLWLKRWDIRLRAAWSIRHCDDLWAVAPHVAPMTFAVGHLRPRPFRVVHTVFDADLFRPSRKKDIDAAIVIASPEYDRWGTDRWTLKGLPAFAEAARAFPGRRFVVIGTDGPWLPFIEFTGFLPRWLYAHVLARTKVIVNASKYEGLNNGLCEAMLSGAIPVVSRIPGNLHAVGGFPPCCGVTFNYGDAAGLREALNVAFALAEDTETVAHARAHVQTRFPRVARRAAFEEFLR